VVVFVDVAFFATRLVAVRFAGIGASPRVSR
jgi:hypothetical protein